MGGVRMTDLMYSVLSMLVLLGALARQPTTVTCPAGWYVEGVRTSGRSSCVRASPETELDRDNCTRGHPCVMSAAPEPRVGVQIYCTNGMLPLVINHRTIGCKRRP